MHNSSHSVAELLPHAPPMVLLDELLDWDQSHVRVAITIRTGIPFFTDDKGVPAHVGLEYMAQACGIYAGLEARRHGQPVRLGFLLGTRNFQASTGWFAPGQRLVIRATETLRHDPMGVFQCTITHENDEIASAQLNLYQPENISDILTMGQGTT